MMSKILEITLLNISLNLFFIGFSEIVLDVDDSHE